MHGIDGRVAIVTGGSSGIGHATALRFAEEGARVVVSDVAEEEGTETVELIEEAGGEAIFHEADVSKASDVEAMVEAAIETYGQLDFAVNNAGIVGETGDVADQTEDGWNRLMDINLRGVFLGMKYQLPAILEQGTGAIVNVSSVAGLIGYRQSGAYVASKHGVAGLTKTAALEYSSRGVRVNAVCPGVIDTPMVSERYANDPEGLEALKKSEPIGRLGDPEEVAAAIVWLCSADASYVTGIAMPVDGGYVAQ